MPEPLKGETKEKYIPRCISYLVKEEGKPQKQAIAICYSMWENKDKKKNEELIEDRIDFLINERICRVTGEDIPDDLVNKKRQRKKIRQRIGYDEKDFKNLETKSESTTTVDIEKNLTKGNVNVFGMKYRKKKRKNRLTGETTVYEVEEK
jgi:hypothetical protein